MYTVSAEIPEDGNELGVLVGTDVGVVGTELGVIVGTIVGAADGVAVGDFVGEDRVNFGSPSA